MGSLHRSFKCVSLAGGMLRMSWLARPCTQSPELPIATAALAHAPRSNWQSKWQCFLGWLLSTSMLSNTAHRHHEQCAATLLSACCSMCQLRDHCGCGASSGHVGTRRGWLLILASCGGLLEEQAARQRARHHSPTQGHAFEAEGQILMAGI